MVTTIENLRGDSIRQVAEPTSYELDVYDYQCKSCDKHMVCSTCLFILSYFYGMH